MQIKTYINEQLTVDFLNENMSGIQKLLSIQLNTNDHIDLCCTEEDVMELANKINFALFKFYHYKAKSLNWTANTYREHDPESKIATEIEEKIKKIKERFADYYKDGKFDGDFPKENPPKRNIEHSEKLQKLLKEHNPTPRRK